MPRVTITIPDKKPQPYRFQLDRKVTRMGRGSENDIVIDCASVSVHHAEMERIEGGFQLRDAGSTNGIKLDGDRKEVIPLRDGTTLKIGDVAFDFQLSEEELDALSREKPMEDSPVLKEDYENARDDDGEEDKPRQEKRPARRSTPQYQPPRTRLDSEERQGAAASFLMTLILFVLAVGAFWAGMEIHHRKLTKSDKLGSRSLVGEIMDGSTADLPADEGGADDEEAPEE